jgi:hypothetical protein
VDSAPGNLGVLTHPFVLSASGFMFAVEFFADKIPGVDSVWDAVQTFVRIPAGAALAAGVFGDAPAAATFAAAILGGTLAAGSHLTKAGSRVAINTVARAVLELGRVVREDLGVGVVLWLAWSYPARRARGARRRVLVMLWLLPKAASG